MRYFINYSARPEYLLDRRREAYFIYSTLQVMTLQLHPSPGRSLKLLVYYIAKAEDQQKIIPKEYQIIVAIDLIGLIARRVLYNCHINKQSRLLFMNDFPNSLYSKFIREGHPIG